MVSAFDLTAVLSIGLFIMFACIGMGYFLFKLSQMTK